MTHSLHDRGDSPDSDLGEKQLYLSRPSKEMSIWRGSSSEVAFFTHKLILREHPAINDTAFLRLDILETVSFMTRPLNAFKVGSQHASLCYKPTTVSRSLRPSVDTVEIFDQQAIASVTTISSRI